MHKTKILSNKMKFGACIQLWSSTLYSSFSSWTVKARYFKRFWIRAKGTPLKSSWRWYLKLKWLKTLSWKKRRRESFVSSGAKRTMRVSRKDYRRKSKSTSILIWCRKWLIINSIWLWISPTRFKILKKTIRRLSFFSHVSKIHQFMTFRRMTSKIIISTCSLLSRLRIIRVLTNALWWALWNPTSRINLLLKIHKRNRSVKLQNLTAKI